LPDGILSRIRVALDSLNPAERRVADIVREQPGRVVHLPIAELASRANVSKRTVVRFCNPLGCQGDQALELALAADLARSQASRDALSETSEALATHGVR
jgi:DNA-binding MurR/RpiR family transcriptional regulator